MSKPIIWAHMWRSPSRVARRARLPRWEQALLVCLVVASAGLLALTLGVGAFRARADAEISPATRYLGQDSCSALIYQLRNATAHYQPSPR
jgi:hypothetical protein